MKCGVRLEKGKAKFMYLDKAVWDKLRAPEIGICLPPEALLLLKD